MLTPVNPPHIPSAPTPRRAGLDMDLPPDRKDDTPEQADERLLREQEAHEQQAATYAQQQQDQRAERELLQRIADSTSRPKTSRITWIILALLIIAVVGIGLLCIRSGSGVTKQDVKEIKEIVAADGQRTRDDFKPVADGVKATATAVVNLKSSVDTQVSEYKQGMDRLVESLGLNKEPSCSDLR